jgi:diguanylate cyclase (GGDEF)-like protein
MRSPELRRAERLGATVALLIADVDHFKHVNDNHGHAAGDRALKGLAGVLVERTRAVDLAGRFGGEEFGIVMPGATARDGLLVAERLRDGLAALADGADMAVTVSVGVAEYPGHGATPEELLRGADVALYAAKDSGRDTVVLALSQLPTRPGYGIPSHVDRRR